jgi:hypothetical protein
MSKLPLACSLLVLFACSGAKPAAKVAPPLTEEQSKSFEDGVDFVASLEGIEGRWRDDWDKDLEVRVTSSDIIALVTVRTLRTDTDPEQRVTHRLLARVDRELVGDAKGELELSVRADEPGFHSVHSNLARLSDKQFVAYVRRSPEGLRWHLSPASDQVVTETESKITQLQRVPNKDGRARVVVHNN